MIPDDVKTKMVIVGLEAGMTKIPGYRFKPYDPDEGWNTWTRADMPKIEFMASGVEYKRRPEPVWKLFSMIMKLLDQAVRAMKLNNEELKELK